MAKMTISISVRFKWWFWPLFRIALAQCFILSALDLLTENHIEALVDWFVENGVVVEAA